MANQQILTEEQADFLAEMMNIGAGNAAAAFEQILKCRVEVTVPKVHIVAPSEVASLIGDATMPVAGVRMDMVGDVTGALFLIMPVEQKAKFIKLIKKSVPFKMKPGELELSVLEEIGNIIAGVYLLAIHDFCRLNIYHTVPTMTIDMVQPLLDEVVARDSIESPMVIVIENEFSVGETGIMTYFMMVLMPSTKKIKTLLDSIKAASDRLTKGERGEL